MKKKYSIKETTKKERMQITEDAIAISSLSGYYPTDETMQIVQQYIEGKKEISELLEEIIALYKVKL